MVKKIVQKIVQGSSGPVQGSSGPVQGSSGPLHILFLAVNAGFTNKPCSLLSHYWLSPKDKNGEIHTLFVRWSTYFGPGIILFVACCGGSPPFRWAGCAVPLEKAEGERNRQVLAPVSASTAWANRETNKTIKDNCEKNQIFAILITWSSSFILPSFDVQINILSCLVKPSYICASLNPKGKFLKCISTRFTLAHLWIQF